MGITGARIADLDPARNVKSTSVSKLFISGFAGWLPDGEGRFIDIVPRSPVTARSSQLFRYIPKGEAWSRPALVAASTWAAVNGSCVGKYRPPERRQ